MTPPESGIGQTVRHASVLAVILVAAAIPRVHTASTARYLPDERLIAIPIADSISFSPGSLNLPLRGPHHPVLPSYFVKVSRTVFGTTPLGYRAVHLIAGLLTIVLVARLAREWFGEGAARWSALLLAFNEYHIGVSVYATAKGPHLLLVTLAIVAFSRFLRVQAPGYLYAAAAATGLAFYCKEHSVLLIPAFAVMLLRMPYRQWLRSRHLYGAAALFAAILVPDVVWNLTRGAADQRATYADHLARIGGLGLTVNHLMFFARDAIQWVAVAWTGEKLRDLVSENPSMNSLFGLLLCGAVLVATIRPLKGNVGERFLLTLFYVVVVFFLLIHPGEPPRNIDPVAWYWIDAALFPAVVVTGSRLDRARGVWRVAGWCLAAAAVGYAGMQMIG